MTHIIIYTKENNIVGFRSEGHSGYAKAGEDIVCAAISVLTINTINSIEQFTLDDYNGESNEEKAVIDFMITSETISNEAQVLLKALQLGLTDIANQNPEYVSIIFREV